jgi:hypothetical protein
VICGEWFYDVIVKSQVTYITKCSREVTMKRREFMAYLFVKSPARTTMVLLTTLLAVLFFSTKAGAAIYDDFTSPGIDQNKWTVTSSGFSQPGDGYLYYSGATPVKEKLTSTTVFPSGVFTMPFADYSRASGFELNGGRSSLILNKELSGVTLRLTGSCRPTQIRTRSM